MKEQNKKALRAYVIVLAIVVALLLVLLSLEVYPLQSNLEDPLMDMVQSRVQIGDSRKSAIQRFSDAWFHAECQHPHTTTIDDLFFYGSRSPDKVEIVLMVSEQTDRGTTVQFLGSVENYMLHLYDYCTPDPSTVFDDGG